MKVHENFARLMMIGGLSLSMALAQTTGTSGSTSQTGAAGQSGSTAGSGQQSDTGRQGSSAQSGSTAGQQSGAGHQGHVAGAGGTGEQSMLGNNDRNFMMKAAQGGMMEVQLAQMAQQKASSDEVKQYAQKLEQDHTKANEQLKQIAQERQVSLPTDPGPHAQQIAKFQNLSGEEFDRAYMKMQVQHHKKDISEFKKQVNRGMDSDLKSFAQAQLPTLEQHLQQAQQISSSTGTRSRSAGHSTSGASSSDTSGNSNSGKTSGSESGHGEHGNTSKSK